MVYQYVAYNEAKEIVKGKLEAKNEEQAAELLNYAGYQLINLRMLATFPSVDKLLLRLFPIKPAEIILFYRQMALLIESGLNIVTALELLTEQTTHRSFKRILGEIISDVRSGSQLSAAMGKHPEIFPAIHCQSLKVGERTGGMEGILRQIAEHLEKKVASNKSVKAAMTYPVIAALVAIVVVAIMVTFVFPTFKGLYASMNIKLPAITQMVLDLGDKARAYGLYIIAVIVAAGFAGYAYIQTAGGRYNWDLLSLKLPLLGRVNHISELARVCRNMSVLYKAGLSLTEIMPLVIQSTTNKVIAEALVTIRDDMLDGAGISRPMSKHAIFLPMMVQMVRVGEETGNLDHTLLSVAQSYEAEAEDKTKSLIALIQPVMTIVIGLVVGLIALSLVSAMYSMYGRGI
jgi:type IV pilus assembly protein PilC